MLCDLRDSLTLFPDTLANLAMSLSPHIGGKESLDHSLVNVASLEKMFPEIKRYLVQDVCMLGAVLVQAQSIYWSDFGVDIGECLTMSSLAMKIFRLRY